MGCPHRSQVTGGHSFRVEEIDEILQRASSNNKALQRIEGRAKIRIYYLKKRKRRKTIRLFYQFEYPNRLQIAVEAVMGQTAAIITNDGEHFAIHNILSKEFVRGKSRYLMKFLSEYVPIQMPVEAFVGVLLGRLPIFRSKDRAIRNDPKDRSVAIITFKQPKLKQVIWVNTVTHRFVKTVIEQEGQKPLKIQYSTFRGKPAYSKLIKFFVPDKGLMIKWIFVELTPKAKIPAKNFTQQAPSGVKVHTVSP